MLHVVFTGDGIPGWIGAAPREGSEPVEKDVMFLASHRRTARGAWVGRDVPVVSGPTPEESRAQATAEAEAARQARATSVRAALAEEADPLFFKWQRGECRKADWLAKVADVKARFPRPGEPRP